MGKLLKLILSWVFFSVGYSLIYVAGLCYISVKYHYDHRGRSGHHSLLGLPMAWEIAIVVVGCLVAGFLSAKGYIASDKYKK